jgi:hypothetical protein
VSGGVADGPLEGDRELGMTGTTNGHRNAMAANPRNDDEAMRIGHQRKGNSVAATRDGNATARSRPLASTLGCRFQHVTPVLALALAALAIPTSTGASQVATADTVITRVIAPGVTHRRITSPAGPWRINVLEIDLRQPELAIRGARACDRLFGRERPSAIARRLRAEGIDVIAVMNADFFDLRGGTGATESNIIVDGEIVKAATLTDSPFDAFDNVHTQFGITTARVPVLERFQLHGIVRTPSGEAPLLAVNAIAAGGLSLLTRWSDSLVVRTAPLDDAVRVPLRKVGGKGDTAFYRVDSIPKAGTPAVGSEHISVLVGNGPSRSQAERLRAGDRVSIVARFSPHHGAMRTLVGGWPRIVEGGKNVALLADSVEGTPPGFSRARHPRTAVGLSRDSATVYLVVVDGRQSASVGMTLEELAHSMIALGAVEALNLDGGGSTTLVVRDSIVNVPSDPNGERPVGNAIVITRHEKAPLAPRTTPRRSEYVPTCVVPTRKDTARVR